MENNLCVKCGGKGIMFATSGEIFNQAGQVIAQTYNDVGQCGECKGTGRATRPVSCGGYLVGFVILVALFAFVINPIAHLISS